MRTTKHGTKVGSSWIVLVLNAHLFSWPLDEI